MEQDDNADFSLSVRDGEWTAKVPKKTIVAALRTLLSESDAGKNAPRETQHNR